MSKVEKLLNLRQDVETSIRNEVTLRLRAHSDEVAVIQDQDLNKPLGILLVGSVMISYRERVDAWLQQRSLDEENVLTEVQFGNYNYIVTPDRVFAPATPDTIIGINQLGRLWLLIARADWDNTASEQMADQLENSQSVVV